MATLHVTNGDSTATTLASLGLGGSELGGRVVGGRVVGGRVVGGRVIVWRDALHTGPVPDVPDAELRHVRAGFLSAAAGLRRESVLRDLEDRDRTLDTHVGDFVLWFEADLYDQLQLVQILARLHARNVDPARISLVCIGEFPGRGHFGGLGELTAAEFGTLLDAGRLLTEAALHQATGAWAALRSPTPTGLGAIDDSDDLRFVGEAFDRLAREYPSTRDGLSLTERRILAGAADAPIGRFDLFGRVFRCEHHPFLGDSWFFATVDSLGPLLARDADMVALTDAGRRVLDGTADRVDLLGIDRWIGGVHVTDGRWRFDEGREAVVPR